MKKNSKFMKSVACFFMIYSLCFSTALAHKDKKTKNESFSSISNEVYKQECGACHFNYHPGLLPSGSWENILNAFPFHFDEEVTIDEKSLNEIGKYLSENSAENSSSKRARKILRSLNGNTPLRISETPYILEKHHELNSAIFDRPSIGSRSNCVACHKTAEQGDFDDDNVKIPQ